MGGILSGGRGWRGGRPAAEDFPVARLTHAETFNTDRRDTFVRTDGTDWCTVVHNGREWPVRLAFTRLHLGGVRRWLVCPCCDMRREALYVAGRLLSCRVCLGLRYETNHENRRARMFRRADAIRERLGWKPGIANPPGPKPPRMHQRTFLRLKSELERLTDALTLNIGGWIERAEVHLDRMHR